MKRIVTVFAVVFVFACSLHGFDVRGQTPIELAETARLVAGFQNADGGFASQPGGPSSLGATTSSLRVLGYTGGAIPDTLGCIRYLKSCFHADSGGFSATPNSKPDVGTTASGLMGLGDLQASDPAIRDGATRYFSENARTFEEIRIAVAGLEAIKAKSEDFDRWKKVVKETENPDGTFGAGVKQAVDTGGRAVALLRMGENLDHRDAIVALLKSAQQPDGAWTQEESGTGSDLGTSYRIMRCFYMLKESPNLEKLKGFVAKCRRPDGSYGNKPGDSNGNANYTAAILLYWSRLLEGEPAITETAGFSPLFNGKDLSGWEGNTQLWSVRDGVLVGESKGLDHNEFLANNAILGSAVIKIQFRVVDGKGNTGVQFRSVRIPGTEMSGYQADLGENYWGCLYDESRRNKILVPAAPKALEQLHKTAWNEYTIDSKGAEIRLKINGETSVEYTETDPAIAREGRVAVQLHAGEPMMAQFKAIQVQPLPEPTESTNKGPGWYLKTLKRAGQKRKYTLYVPEAYNGQTSLPVILFLHGSGERGADGIKPAQVGLGPAIVKNPSAFPAIVIFPQALKTWKAGSADAADALAALEEVLAEWKTDPRRVALTGLSMGGQGAWDLGARYPERFAAVVPVCGRSNLEQAGLLTKRPVWTFIGDRDRLETVQQTRSMVQALLDNGARPRYTEYRNVDHNSWDRAYNDPALSIWILQQSQ